MQLYDRGIRRRLPPMLNGDQRRLALAMSLMFTLPGTPVVRYGDEIGMGDDLALEERHCSRTPMQWSTEPHGGFSKAAKTILPVIDEGPWSYQRINAAAQRRDPDSLLNWTERIIRMRKECPEIGWGDFRVLPTGRKSVLALRYEWRNNAVVALHNLADEPVEISVRVRGGPAGQPLLRRAQRAQGRRRAPHRARAVRLSLVSRRRARLPAQAAGILMGACAMVAGPAPAMGGASVA